MKRKSDEYQKFDDTMTKLLKVPHSEIKEKLDAEKASKPKKSASQIEKSKTIDR